MVRRTKGQESTWLAAQRPKTNFQSNTSTNRRRSTMIQKTLLTLAGTVCGALAFLSTPALATTWQCTKGTKCRVRLQGKGQQVFKISGLTFECRKLRGEGQVEGRKKDLQIGGLKLAECSAEIAGVKHKIKIEPKACESRFTLVKQNKEKEAEEAQGTISIKPAACLFTVSVEGTSCQVTIKGEQGPFEKFRAKQVLGSEGVREVQIQTKIGAHIAAIAKGCGIPEKRLAEYEGRARIFSNTKGVGIKLR